MSKGYTLIEVLVVLVVMGLAVALVAPSFVTRRDATSALADLVQRARATAIRRAEAVTLRVDAAGRWDAGGLASGTLPQPPAAPVTVIFSPLGSCAPDVASTSAGRALGLDPLTCEGRPR